ncbi:hypothetical protein BDY17DRAFT_323760 [Neohortaea acidophila]|uniref:Uncharacterized protein n=1 Tax=Neohortaea acidophila TaxID=245834 RepID=A0A6A6PTI5_9PEZI|nr:uncharacterized protein BDY17DRAFT_323760 [Neohortaea acidophila]KAF2482994.1 hypothetical protein BDY17DRAFT_323760 [Neohortaea acidophila]
MAAMYNVTLLELNMVARPRVTLLTLPVSVRKNIYAMVFSDSNLKISSSARQRKDKPTPPSVGILLANKQLYDEAITQYYRYTTFYMTHSTKAAKAAASWIAAIPVMYRVEIQDIVILDASISGVWLGLDGPILVDDDPAMVSRAKAYDGKALAARREARVIDAFEPKLTARRVRLAEGVLRVVMVSSREGRMFLEEMGTTLQAVMQH